jgi:hypothetical protein
MIWSRSPDGDRSAASARRPRIAAFGRFTVSIPVSAHDNLDAESAGGRCHLGADEACSSDSRRLGAPSAGVSALRQWRTVVWRLRLLVGDGDLAGDAR